MAATGSQYSFQLHNYVLFYQCFIKVFFCIFQPITTDAFFENECIPNIKTIETLFTDLDDTKYPHAWRGAVICFVFGLGLMVLTDLFALLTVCCRRCICCSVFTICGSIQSFASILFTLGKHIFVNYFFWSIQSFMF